MSIDIDRLRAKAEALADADIEYEYRSPWYSSGSSVTSCRGWSVAETDEPACAAYIAAANPATVLAMIDEIEKHREDDNLAVMNEDFCKLLRSLGISDHARHDSCHRILHDEILPEIERLRGDRDSLLRIINDSFLSLHNPYSTMAFDGRNLTPHVEEASRASVILHGEIGEARKEIERLRERNAKLERVREAATKLGPGPGESCYCCEAQAWVEFDAALDAAKERP